MSRRLCASLPGPGCLDDLGRELDRLEVSRAVIVCGRTLAREGSPLDLVRAALGDRDAGVVPLARPHSPLPSVVAAAAELDRLGADAVIAVGGGSAIVTARAAAIVLAEGADLARLSTAFDADGRLRSPKLMAEKLPQIVVPTTPTTAMVKAGTAVYDPQAGRRRAMFDPKTRAQAVFIDPALTAPTPAGLFVSASLNTIAMAVEGLISRGGDPIADALLMHALRLAAASIARPDVATSAAARGDLMTAALLCGRGTDHTGGGIGSALAYAIGARHGAENGVVNAILLPSVLRFNAGTAAAGYARIAEGLGTGDADGDAVAGAFERLFEGIDIPRRLRDLGVPWGELPEVAAIAIGDWLLRGNPRSVRSAVELERLLEAAW